MISSQMLKGTLEGCILGIISRKETYGGRTDSGRLPREPFIPFFCGWKKTG